MILDAKNLPLDTNLLHQIVTDLMKEVILLNDKVASLEDKNTSLEEKMLILREQLTLLKKRLFGTSSEKMKAKIQEEIDELESKIEEGEQEAAVLGDTIEEETIEDEESEYSVEAGEKSDDNTDSTDAANNQKSKEKKKPKRQKLPEHLERITQILNPDPVCPDCGNEKFRTIGEEASEILEYMPASFKVIRYIRPRCVCTECEKMVQSYPANKTIAKGMAGPGLLAHILVQKYCNHLPFYRQSEMYDREDIDLSRSTMASWAGQIARLLMPLVEELKKSIFASSHIHSDDTTLKVLAPGLGKTKIGRLWTYVRDGRRYGDKDPPAVCYFYSPDRKGERPEEHLKNFTGVLHADAYAGYNGVYIDTANPKLNPGATITEAACWGHTRRKFHEITVCNKKAAIAHKSLEQIGEIYEIEAKIRGKDPDKRLEERQKTSKQLLEKLFVDWKKYQKDLPKKSSTAQAIQYALNNEVALKRFLSDGKIEIDNNIAERAMRTVALGRKNYLFAGSDAGGETAAAIYSLTETAKLNDINPWLYLKTVFEVIQDYNSTKLADLLPWNLKLTSKI
jgi:transposase